MRMVDVPLSPAPRPSRSDVPVIDGVTSAALLLVDDRERERVAVAEVGVGERRGQVRRRPPWRPC